jgi:hypothetical protein
MNNNLLDVVGRGVRRLSFWEFNAGLAVLLLTGLVNGLWLLASPPPQFITQTSSTAGRSTELDASLVWIAIRIELALVVAGFGLLSRRSMGLLISMLSLVWVGAEYLRWYRWRYSFPQDSPWSDPRFSLEAGRETFYGVTGWNLAVLMVAAVVLVWEVSIAVRALRASDANISD